MMMILCQQKSMFFPSPHAALSVRTEWKGKQGRDGNRSVGHGSNGSWITASDPLTRDEITKDDPYPLEAHTHLKQGMRF